MKLLIAAPHFPPRYIGGTERIAQRMASALSERGHQVHVVCVDSVNADSDELVCDTAYENGIWVHRLGVDLSRAGDRLRWAYRNPLIEAWLRQFLQAEAPDVVHLLSGYLISGCVAEAAREYSIPVVITLLDYWFICPLITLMRANGDLCADPVPAARCEWCLRSGKRRYRYLDQSLGGLPGELFSRIGQASWLAKLAGARSGIEQIEERRAYLKNTLENADAVITHSRFLMKKVTDYGISGERMIYLPNGLEPSTEEQPGSTGEHRGPVRIGYTGQVAPHKGVEVLLRAFLKAGLPPEQAELHIYGKLEQWPEYSSRLAKLANGRPGVFFEGPYPADETGSILKNLDVVVVPSLWFENRPTVIMEAFSRGRPVIASNMGGMAEMVKDGVDGFLFEPGDSGDLARILRQVVETPGLLARLSEGITPVKPFREELDEIEKIYLQLLERKGAAPGRSEFVRDRVS